MKIARDKVLHLAGGVLMLLCAALVVAAYTWFGPGPAAALATTLGGVGYELQQIVRGEGEPSLADAATTAAPGWLLWMVLAA